MSGNWREEHPFVLRQALAMYDDIARHLGECDTKLQALLSDLGQTKVSRKNKVIKLPFVAAGVCSSSRHET